MANCGEISAIAEAYVEEKLMCSILIGPPEPCKGLLDSLEHVDVRMLRQRTLLHVGVRLGKVEWVEELLGRGADPNLKDGSDVTALQSAEEILRKYPDDSDRRHVLRLMRLVQRRDHAMRRRIETSFVGSALTLSCPVIEEEHVAAMAALSSSMDALKEEMRLLRAEVRSSMEELKKQVCGRDALLRCLEEAVTSSAEQLTSLRRLEVEPNSGAIGTTLETPLSLSNMAEKRQECVDGILAKTTIVYGGKNGVNRVRCLYEMIYDTDDATGCLLQFLHGEFLFEAKVDCGYRDIGRMKKTMMDLDGLVILGNHISSLAEFFSNTVYLAAKVSAGGTEKEVTGRFVKALAQMSLYLCFRNRGKPYKDGDKVHEEQWKRAFEEVEEKERGGKLHPWIGSALHWSTQSARECDLTATVPWVIAHHGSSEGTRMLREHVPLLFDFYKENVVATLLLAKAREL